MIDIIIVICCVLGGFALGKYFEKKIVDKGKFYRDLSRYALTLKENVNGRQLELHKFNSEFAKTCGKPFAEYVSSGKLTVHLSKAQQGNLSVFFNNLDCASSQELLQHLEYQGKVLADDCKDVCDNEVAKASIYSKLGMLLGAMLGILLV